ncbi:MAG: diacylglyceryl transferase, partial [Pedobacter sp.]
LHPIKKTITIGEPASMMEMLSNAFFGFLVGYKLVYAAFNYNELINDAQGVILSGKGNFIGGVIAAAAFAYLAYADKNRTKLPKPKKVEIIQHPYEIMSGIVLWAAVWGFLGAKLFDNLEHWDSFIQDPIGGLLSFSGLTFYGGLICGGAAVLYIANKNGIKPLHMLDVGGPGMMLAYSVGRIGCHLSGDGDWGLVNTSAKPFTWLPDWAWAYTYPNNVAMEGDKIPGCVGKFCTELPLPVYPTPLYEVIMAFLLFMVLWKIRHRIKLPGMLFGIYLIFNGVERFFIELIRVNTKYRVGDLAFTQAELISLILIICGIGLIFYARKNKSVSTQ